MNRGPYLLASNGLRPSAGKVMNAKLNIYFTKFHCLLMLLDMVWVSDDIHDEISMRQKDEISMRWKLNIIWHFNVEQFHADLLCIAITPILLTSPAWYLRNPGDLLQVVDCGATNLPWPGAGVPMELEVIWEPSIAFNSNEGWNTPPIILMVKAILVLYTECCIKFHDEVALWVWPYVSMMA